MTGRQRGQSGITLLEIMLAMMIGTLLMVPLGAWAIGTIRAGVVSRTELGRSNATGLLNVYFLRDVASSRSFETSAQNPTDCANVPAGSAGTPVLRMGQSGDTPKSVVYVVNGAADPVSVIRHVCDHDGNFEQANKVMPKAQRASVVARCLDQSGTDTTCEALSANRVELTMRPITNDQVRRPVTVSGARRVNTDGTGFSTSNPPQARVSLTPSAAGYSDTVFTVENRSVDPDGDPLTVTWSFEAGSGASIVSGGPNTDRMSFTMARSGQVVMSVSDGSNTAAGGKFVRIINRPPVIDSITPCTLVSGRTYSFGATASDPDAPAVVAAWRDAAGTLLSNTFNATWVAPPEASGDITFQLTVSDPQGESVQREVRCSVGVVTPPGGVDFSLVASPTGAFNAIPAGQQLPLTFTAQNPGTADISWQLFRTGVATPVDSALHQNSWTRNFATPDRGEYEIVRLTDGVAGGRIPFRVNAAPNVSLSSTGQAGQVPARDVDLRTDASDLDGTIVRTTWDFGDGSPINTAPAGAGTHTYTAAGTYVVTFTATDNDGGFSSTTINVVVPAAPVKGGG